MPRKIIVVEGPAGSGKSTLISRIIHEGRGVLLEPTMKFDRPRSYDGIEGLTLSLAKDTMASIGIAGLHLGKMEDDPLPIILDRWCLSQWVYGNIRRGKLPNQSDRHQTDECVRSIFSSLHTLDAVTRELALRAGQHEYLQFPYEVHFVVLMPWLELLKSHRAKKPYGHYPYEAFYELEVYHKALQGLYTYSSSNFPFPVRFQAFAYMNYPHLDDRYESYMQNTIL